MSGLTFINYTAPWVAAGCLVGLLALVSGWTSGRHLDRGKRLVLLAVRLAAVLALLATILRPAMQGEIFKAKRPPLAVLVDDSGSMTMGGGEGGGATALEWLENLEGRWDELAQVYKPKLYTLGEPAERIEPPRVAGWGDCDG